MFCYCAESRRAARLLTARYDQALAGSGLSSAQFELMSVLFVNRQVHGRELADLLVVDPTTLSRNLKALVAEKIVRAQKSVEDARQTEYSLTAKGSQRLTAAKSMWEQAHHATAADLGTVADTARDTLQSMTERLRA